MTCSSSTLSLTAFLFLSLSTAACTGTVAGDVPNEDARPELVDGKPVGEDPSTLGQAPDPAPAKVRIAHLWENRDAVDVCVLLEDEPGTKIQPVSRTYGATSDLVTGGVPQYQVGRFVRVPAGVRNIKIVPATAEDCAAPAIVSAKLRLASGTSTTFVLWGTDTQRPEIESVVDLRLPPEEQVETVRFYDFAIAPDAERAATFEKVRLEDSRREGVDAVFAPSMMGRFQHVVGNETVSHEHLTRERGMVTVFSAGVVADGTFRLIVCEDHDRANGALSDCR